MSIATRLGHAALAEELRACFSRPGEALVGIEEELMLLHPETLDLLPRVADVVGGPDPDERLHLELPAAQVEIVLPPARRVDDAVEGLHDARSSLARRAGEIGLLAGAGAHPFAALEGVLNTGGRYDEMEREFGAIARRQLAFGLHVHVCVRGAERVVAVHDALRSYLPELAALAANAPFQDGRDSGLASVRPTLCGLLPRQGVPPTIGSLDAFAADLEWGARAGRVPGPHRWWWELRLHPVHGTLEVRVCDAQATVEDTRGVAAVVRALVHHLAGLHDAGEPLPVANTWRIAENRWLAARDGLDAHLADLETGEVRPVRERWDELLEMLAPTAARLGDTDALSSVRALLRDGGGAARQRAAADGDARAATRWLADRFRSPD